MIHQCDMFASVKTIGERDGEDGGTNPYFFTQKVNNGHDRSEGENQGNITQMCD